MNNRRSRILAVLRPPMDGPRAAAAIRLMAGAVFLWEGILKFVYSNQGVGRFTKLGFPFPAATASLVGGLEVCGGVLLIVGLGTRLISTTFVAEMLVAILSTKPRLFLGTSPLPLPPVPPQVGLWAVLHEMRSEYAQLMSCVFLMAAGPGPWSLDALLASRDAVGRATSSDVRAHVVVPEAAGSRGTVGLRGSEAGRFMAMVLLGVTLHSRMAGASGPPSRPLTRCPLDAVVVGAGCMDKYEASVWRVPNPTTLNRALVTRIRQGTATLALMHASGATQLGVETDDYAPCTDDGQSCADDVYALSLPGVTPSASITWFQATEACANAGKRLPTNAEWQVAADGTPDAGPDDRDTTCNTASNAATSPTGERRGCVSTRGAFDMVGNVAELVADWVPLSTACPGWGALSDDVMCLAGASLTGSGPGVLVRGGSFLSGPANGPLAVVGTFAAGRSEMLVGFRCVR